MLVRAALLCMGIVLDAGANELREAARGLAVSIEDLAGTVAINGLALEVSRAVGPAVPRLAEQMIARWRGDSGSDAVRTESCCGWQIASRIRDGRSQVIQWRSTTDGSELYLSTVNSMERVGQAPDLISPLPSGCSWTTPVHGQVSGTAFVQMSASCALPAAAMLDESIRRLSSEGWRWRRLGAATLQAQRGPTVVQMIAFPRAARKSPAQEGNSSIVIVETRPGRDRQR